MDQLLLSAVLIVSLISLCAIYFAVHYKIKFDISVVKQRGKDALINHMAEGVYRSSLDGKQLSANPALVKLNGYDTEEELLASVGNISNEWYVEPGRRAEFTELLQAEGQITDFVSEIYRHKTRERIWITENARLVRHARTGKPLYYEGTVRDITDSVAKQKADTLLQNLTDKLPHGLFRLIRHSDRTFSCPYVSKRFREMTNLPEGVKFDALTFAERVHPEERELYESSLRMSRLKMIDWQCEFRFRWPTGEYHWYHLQATPEHCKTGDTIWHGYVSNIDERRADEARIHRLAYFDQLTKLPNRPHFINMARERLQRAQEKNTFSAIGFIDLDNFKLLNDTHGHGFGDRLLQTVAERLAETCADENAVVSRFGGDEFVVMISDIGSTDVQASQRISDISQAMMKEINKTIEIDGVDCQITISLGITLCDPKLELRISDLLKSADVAMYEVKKSGRNNAVIHDKSMLEQVAERYQLQRDIKEAIKDQQFATVVQPQFDRDGKLVSAETLVRWDHPEHGRIMPSDFIELAEQTGLITKINEWVLERSVEKLAAWQSSEKLSRLGLSVNISPQQMLDSQFVSWVKKLVQHHNIDKHTLMLEMTEHAMAKDPDTVEKNMRILQQYGIRFSLDDFGTGYSSIARLRKLPFDELKVDGSFVADIGKHDTNLELVTAILNMAKAMGLRTVAEHVSSHEQFDVLSELGCDMFQGYLFSRPLSTDDFEDLANASIAVRDMDLRKECTHDRARMAVST